MLSVVVGVVAYHYVQDYRFEKFYNSGVSSYSEGNYTDARKNLTKAIGARSGSARAYYYRGLANAHLGETNRAGLDLSIAINLDRSNAEFFLARARIFEYEGNQVQAMVDYRNAVAASPSSHQARMQLAFALATFPFQSGGDPVEAVEQARKACELGHKDWKAMHVLALCYAQAGQFDEAIRWQERVVESAPRDVQEDLFHRLERLRAGESFLDEPVE